ncbi:MAG: peptidoglycan DD-metalloendopeptidase family protein [Sphingomonadales bacterium]
MIKRLIIAFGTLTLALVAGCAPADWNGGEGGPMVARNTPRPIPIPRPKPAIERPVAKGSAARAPIPASPGEKKHEAVVVRRGDTVYGLARRHGVNAREIVVANNLRPPYRLAVGQKLEIPAPRTYVVRQGDTGYSISRRFGVGLTELMRIKRVAKPYRLKVGQKLKLPSRSRRPIPQTVVASNNRAKPDPAPPPRAGSSFAWPARGTIVSRFGAKKGGLHNDGINIRVSRQQPVRAAENGVVVYVGNELKSFGKLLLVRHAGNWVTAYAHNDALLVKEGDRISRGQIIARAGSTGRVKNPQLHFEIRKGTRAVDPLRYLPLLQAALADN